MNKGKKVLNNLLFIFIVAIICVGSYFAYTFFTGKENVFMNIINDNSSSSSNTDNYNGVYVYSDNLSSSYQIYGGCVVKSLDQYIVVVEDEYYYYDHTCMGTYEKGSGRTSELNFEFDNDSKLYKVNYNDKEFKKDLNVSEVVPGNVVEGKIETINFSTYKFVLKHTQFEGNYYNLTNKKISGTYNYKMNIIPGSDGSFNLTVQGIGKDNEVIAEYNVHADSADDLPDLNLIYGRIASVVRNRSNEGLYNFDLTLFDKTDGIVYDFRQLFPIYINDQKLDYDNNSVYINYNKLTRSYNLFIGYDNKFCTDDSDSSSVAYYLFKIEYDSKNLSLSKPIYQATYLKKDGCSDFMKLAGDI